MSRTKNVLFLLNEGEDATFKFKSTFDASGETVTFRYRVDGGSGSATTAGTATGQGSNTLTSIDCSFSSLTPGVYDFWVYSDYAGGSEKLLIPNNDEVAQFEIVERE